MVSEILRSAQNDITTGECRGVLPEGRTGVLGGYPQKDSFVIARNVVTKQ